jgi:hypothetical protein
MRRVDIHPRMPKHRDHDILVIAIANYALIQGANNSTIVEDINAEQRGVISGMLSCHEILA